MSHWTGAARLCSSLQADVPFAATYAFPGPRILVPRSVFADEESMFQVLRRLAVAASILALVSPAQRSLLMRQRPKRQRPKPSRLSHRPARYRRLKNRPVRRRRSGNLARRCARQAGRVQALGHFPVPTDWPEQQVKAVGEQISAGVRHRYRTTDGLKQMVFNLPQSTRAAQAEYFVTFETTRLPQKPPLDPGRLILPRECRRKSKSSWGPVP